MDYLHIENLYRPSAQIILLLKEVWALEKVHGTSAHVSYKISEFPNVIEGKISYFSGGESHEKFVKLFNQEQLLTNFANLGHPDVTIFGEAYGKQQGMSATYGSELKFIVFDVRIGTAWLDVPDAHDVANKLGLEFVPYRRVTTNLDELDRERDRPSEIAERRGMGTDKVREGVVLRPITELTDKRGNRIIVKHKGDAFSERAHPQKVVDPAKIEVLREAQEVADEFGTEIRLQHVLDKLPEVKDMSHTSMVIKAMVEDIRRECVGEFVETPEVLKAISRRAGELWRKKVSTINEPGVEIL